MLVTWVAPPDEVFTAVVAEVHMLLDTDLTAASRYDPDDMTTVVGAWTAIDGPPLDVGYRRRLGERTVRTLVFRTCRPARIDDLSDEAGPWGTAAVIAAATEPAGARVSDQAAAASACAWAGGTMARPPGSKRPASSNRTIPLQSRLHPCSG